MTSAEKKRLQKKFPVGTVVTWGLGKTSHRVIEVLPHGVIVDVINWNGRPLFVSWGGRSGRRDGTPETTESSPLHGRNPLRISTRPPEPPNQKVQ